jgi:hypothetical protein
VEEGADKGAGAGAQPALHASGDALLVEAVIGTALMKAAARMLARETGSGSMAQTRFEERGCR